jgi:hypothetical protein
MVYANVKIESMIYLNFGNKQKSCNSQRVNVMAHADMTMYIKYF